MVWRILANTSLAVAFLNEMIMIIIKKTISNFLKRLHQIFSGTSFSNKNTKTYKLGFIQKSELLVDI